MVHNEGTFTTPDSLTIYHQSWMPDGEPKAVEGDESSDAVPVEAVGTADTGRVTAPKKD